MAAGRCATCRGNRRARLVRRAARGRDHGKNVRLRRGGQILGIDTLETIAANIRERAGASSFPPIKQNSGDHVPNSSGPGAGTPRLAVLEVVLDAQRGEIVAGTFSRSEDGWFRPTSKQHLVPIDRWLAELFPRGRGRPGSHSVAVTGPILKKLRSRIPPGIMVLDEHYWRPAPPRSPALLPAIMPPAAATTSGRSFPATPAAARRKKNGRKVNREKNAVKPRRPRRGGAAKAAGKSTPILPAWTRGLNSLS